MKKLQLFKLLLTTSGHCSYFIAPEMTGRPKVFMCFQGL